MTYHALVWLRPITPIVAGLVQFIEKKTLQKTLFLPENNNTFN